MRSRLREAEQAFVKAISLRPDYPEALMNLATVRRNRGNLEDAERLLRRSLELRPNWADAQINLANVALAQGRFEEATKLFSSALQAEPGYVHLYESFARAASRAGKLDEAAAAFRRLLSFDPDNVVSRHLLAACTSDSHCESAPEVYVRKLFDLLRPAFRRVPCPSAISGSPADRRTAHEIGRTERQPRSPRCWVRNRIMRTIA